MQTYYSRREEAASLSMCPLALSQIQSDAAKSNLFTKKQRMNVLYGNILYMISTGSTGNIQFVEKDKACLFCWCWKYEVKMGSYPWLFGRLEPGGAMEYVLAPVGDRAECILKSHREKNILEESLVMPSGWTAYSGINHPFGMESVQSLVIQEKHFVDPRQETIYMQVIESFWKGAKKKLYHHPCGTNQIHFQSYMKEFIVTTFSLFATALWSSYLNILTLFPNPWWVRFLPTSMTTIHSDTYLLFLSNPISLYVDIRVITTSTL